MKGLVGSRFVWRRIVHPHRGDLERLREPGSIEDGSDDGVLPLQAVDVLWIEVLLDHMLVDPQPGVEAHAVVHRRRAEELIYPRRVDVGPAAEERIEGIHRLLRPAEIAGANRDPRVVLQMRDDFLALAVQRREFPAQQILLQAGKGEGGQVLVLVQVGVGDAVQDGEQQTPASCRARGW
ncbi:MAG: hypothetical protein GEU82_07825 [Luteitalea sp.]|nr:hypothetical protein [Luteitalea sp.]